MGHYITLKTNGSPLKMDGWNTILSYRDSAYFQVRLLLVSGRVDGTVEARSNHQQRPLDSVLVGKVHVPGDSSCDLSIP